MSVWVGSATGCGGCPTGNGVGVGVGGHLDRQPAEGGGVLLEQRRRGALRPNGGEGPIATGRVSAQTHVFLEPGEGAKKAAGSAVRSEVTE